MIFVTVGNATQGFIRLLGAVDTLAASGVFEPEEIFLQTGNTKNFRPMHCAHQDFLTMDEFQERMMAASLIICHGGCGTLLHAVRLGKIPVAMPRLKKYGEHVNDHQLQIVEALACEGRVAVAREPSDLPCAIADAKRRMVPNTHVAPSRMLDLVAQAIADLAGDCHS